VTRWRWRFGADGRAHVSLEQAGAVRLDPRLRTTPLESAIPTIPYGAIAAFLSRPTVITDDDIRHAPYVLAFRDMHEGRRLGQRSCTCASFGCGRMPASPSCTSQIRCATRMTARWSAMSGI